MVIQGSVVNLSSNRIIQSLERSQNMLKSNLERLGTGLRIRGAKDDPGGLIISNRLASQFRGLDQASVNAQRGINIATVASEGVNKITSLLQDIRSNVVAAQNTNNSNEHNSYQRQIQEKLEEINTIASETKYQNTRLLDGTYSSKSQLRPGTKPFGGKISFGPDSSVLSQGPAFLNITKIQEGREIIKTGGDKTINTGIRMGTDIAVSFGQLALGSDPAEASDTLHGLSFNRVSLQNQGSIVFSGTLANGKTNFGGSLSIASSTTINDLITKIQGKIDNAENSIGIDGSDKQETNVRYNNSSGRVEFYNSEEGAISQFNLNFTVKDAGDTKQSSFGVLRTQHVENEMISSTSLGGKIGNSISAITGSTFSSGEYEIQVNDLLSPANREIQTEVGFFKNVSLTNPVSLNTRLKNTFVDGVSLAEGDVITFNGMEVDGSTFKTAFTVNNSAGSEDYREGRVSNFGDLINGLNNRNRANPAFGFNQSTASLNPDGTLSLQDDIANTSSTNLSFYITNIRTEGSGDDISIVFENSQTFDSEVITAGNPEQASFSVENGPQVTASAGEVITLQGGNVVEEGIPTPELTFRVSNNLTEGNDRLVVTEELYEGSLNDGPAVQFRNGQKNVIFTSGSQRDSASYQQIQLDFDNVLDITSTIRQGSEKFVLSSATRELNFQVGEGPRSTKPLFIPDLRTHNLGLDEENTLEDINVTTLSGANKALEIVDQAIEEISLVEGRLTSFTNRLQETTQHLDFTSFIIEDSYNQITNVDIAQETTDMLMNSIYLETRAALLMQANTLNEKVFEILYGLE